MADCQIIINEVSAAQNTGYGDEDGDFPDWIELYNSGNQAVDLEGYTITRMENNNVSWIFPSIEIEANDHLVVFASEKDRRDFIDHWEVPSHPQVNWNYYSGATDPPSDWNQLSFSAGAWNVALAGIGYGDGDDVTVIAPTTTLYMRNEFTISDTSDVSVALVAIDYDDSFVAYLNGVELARNNIGIPGVDPLHTELAYEEHEAQLYTGGDVEYYFVDLAIMNAAKIQGNNVFSVEVHNVDPASDDMTAIPYFIYGVSSNTATYASFDAASNLHTNFNISSFPSRLKLFDNSSNLIDEVILNDVHVNHSMGRASDGGSQWCIFETPTPDTTNSLSPCYNGYGEPPTLSLDAGFYSGSQSISISASQSGNIHFTSDGSIPTQASSIYFSPITVTSNATIKAILIPQDNTLLPSTSTVASYFIDEDVSVPVISLTTNPENLWDYNTGIYVFGPNADSVNLPFFGSNFWAGWEKECHVEYFDRDKNKGFGLDAGLKIHGNFSKAWPQKSFRILAKDDYNNKWINYRLFPEKPYRNRYKNFNIRNAGIDYNTVHFRDALMHRAATGLNLEHMAYEPCVLFLNGEYWGVYGLRERQDDSYIEENYSNVDKENIDLLRFEGDVLAGSNEGFLEMLTHLVTTDLSVQENFDYVADNLLDIKNVADYFITETYYCNVDWLSETSSNNVKYWRTNNPPGKWRYVLWDTDIGTGLFYTDQLLYYNYLGDVIGPTYTGVHPTLIKSLLANEGYAQYFINRYADLLNTNFHPVNLERHTKLLQGDLQSEMARHFTKWDQGPISIFGTEVARSTNVAEWEANIDTLVNWTNLRPQIVRDHIQGMIASPNQVDITLAVYPDNAGYIHINTITPDSLPWTGRYFNGVPVEITAHANSGFVFDHWEMSSIALADSSAISFEQNVSLDESVTAHFDPLEFDVDVYPNPSSGDFTIDYEIVTATQISIDLITVDGKLEERLVSHENIHPEGKFSIALNKQESQLSQGVYFLVFKSSDFTKSIKLVVQ